MQNSFKECRLGEICKIHRGLSFKSTYYLESGTPVLKIGNVDGGKVIKENLFYCDEKSHKVLDMHRVRYEDVVITNLAPAGKVAINLTNLEFILSSHVFKLDPNPEILDRRYLYYFLMNSPRQIEQMLTAANVVRIHMSSLEKFKILVPDLETQRSIVAKLDKFRELREELKMRKRQGVYYRNKIMGGLQECVFPK
ncbi:type I restriction-modification system, S subunit [Mycoplasma haemofelis str. Langford 1]|uniref:Type I restriction enzyme specificity HsdS domain protein n=2 Tax=Mycoplasma haemofelis TaxID=29501 RepID=F6FIK9_MYCHI|nr:restriction endonuclease subunit S [Mycoplasma haemofelis]AEG73057.1 type I restriction enzyme specificity HsdS domain protein [Mycoplasma haemofelis Ohio2]CBY92722.1 type I restriction-modification system, S subunit [Mycoplasma haemofelis str. Langford 1]